MNISGIKKHLNYNNVRNDLVSNEIFVIIEQYAANVIDFSSQYGCDYSISYTAFNITGKPSKYPDYGDFPETFAMRTYGEWWDKAPSKCTEIMPQNYSNIPIHDFIVLGFEDFVYPEEIWIYETYNPGAVVKIWAYTMCKEWICVWSGLPQKISKARILKIKINKLPYPTRIIRLEFNHSKLDYYTEIDAVTLIGRPFVPQPNQEKSHLTEGKILKQLKKEFSDLPVSNNPREDIFKDFLKNGLEKFMEEAGLLNNDSRDMNQLSLIDLPFEILYKIFSYLDLLSLFRISRACRKLYDIATDPSLYNEISLKPYWYCASSQLLSTLTKRATQLKKMDLSWCGLFNAIQSSDFKELITQRGENFTHLRLNSCSFLTNPCIELIGTSCINLKELSLRNFEGDPSFLWGLVSLRYLERLDLFRSVTEQEVLFSILKNNPNLKHLNLGFCGLSVDMDAVAQFIGKYNKQIISIDMWKSHSLTSVGIQALSECPNLEEIDFSWCLREEASPGESLKLLFKKCPKLTKIFLAAIRGITDRDLENITELCSNVEQLDLMGIMGISTEMVHTILVKCKKLQLLDLSFCDQLDDLQIVLWREAYGVSIKKSLSTSEFLF